MARPIHTCDLLNPLAFVPEDEDPITDAIRHGPYASFLVSRSLRYVLWPVECRGSEGPHRRFVLNGMLAPGGYAPGDPVELYEDGSCVIRHNGSGSRYALNRSQRIELADATDAQACPSPDPFGRTSATSALQPHLCPTDVRPVPYAWTVFQNPEEKDVFAAVRYDAAIENALIRTYGKILDAERLLERPPLNTAASNAVEEGKRELARIIHGENGLKDRIARVDGLSIHVDGRRWKNVFRAVDAMRFSSDGKHLAVVGDQAGWRVAIDDQAGPGFDRIVGFRWSAPNACGYIAFRDGRIWRVTVEL